MRATDYPAECLGSGRRARDVMPAAARALVRTIGWLETVFVMTGSNNERRILAHKLLQRNRLASGMPASQPGSFAPPCTKKAFERAREAAVVESRPR